MDSMNVESFYEKNPYPPVGLLTPFFSSIRADDLPLLNYYAGYAACFESTQDAKENPRILVAGCGTTEPVAVALANPGAEIVAVDFSKEALSRLERMAKWKKVKLQILQGDILHPQKEWGTFDYIIATGVLHHLPQPIDGMNSLERIANPRAIFRFMLYSRRGRELLYGAKELARIMGIQDAISFRKLIDSLPADHPYRIYFHLYRDTETDIGLSDGYLHPIDHPYTALRLEEDLARAGLEAKKFLHRPSGQPETVDEWKFELEKLRPWQKLELLELSNELEENFCFFAKRAQEKISGNAKHPKVWKWTPCLPKKGSLFSKLLEKKIFFDTRTIPSSLSERALLYKALLLLPTDAEEEKGFHA